MKKYTIYGERCSGTTYLQTLIETNFQGCAITWEYGWKHFFLDSVMKSAKHLTIRYSFVSSEIQSTG